MRETFSRWLCLQESHRSKGGIGYNLPYSKNVSLSDSLFAWNQVDATCGVLAEAGVVIDRELFGTLTAVLIPPPSVSQSPSWKRSLRREQG